jgi:glycosyltransferase involved in cell wall biosynthesis
VKRLLIFYSQFYPAFKSGGPIQSLVNLVELVRHDFEVFVVCSARDMGESTDLPGIVADDWNLHKENVKVYYIGNREFSSVRRIFNEIRPDIVYVNGMFTPTYSVLPLWFARFRKCQAVLAPRGMLQKGALSLKPLKKKIFLAAFKFLGFHKDIIWHATDHQESMDIRSAMGSDVRVSIVLDTPKKPAPRPVERKKDPGTIRMVYLSLIVEKKNLRLILESLKNISSPVQFDVYGPIMDRNYWETCQPYLNQKPHWITYKGAATPDEVQEILAKYHVFILPTRGENFGHAIYEAFSVGTPAIISEFTPWGDLDSLNAGHTIDLDIESVRDSIQSFIECDAGRFSTLSSGAHAVATRFYCSENFRLKYNELFSQ